MTSKTPVERLPVVDWALVDHCGARSLLERAGWRFVAAGDWAIVLADPKGLFAARVSPFELAYQYFEEVCTSLSSNRWLPQIHQAAALVGGGHLTVMDLLEPRGGSQDDSPDPVWSRTDDPHLASLRREVERIDRLNRGSVPWWGGIDVRAEHFMTAPDGQLKLVDPFYVSGADLYAAVLDDYEAFGRVVPYHRHRFMLQIPHFSQPYALDQLIALRAAIHGNVAESQ